MTEGNEYVNIQTSEFPLGESEDNFRYKRKKMKKNQIIKDMIKDQ